MLRNPLQPLLRPLLRAPTAPSSQSVLRRALAILRRPGIEAHVYIPGIGTISGLQAASYLDSVGTTAATVDSPVGLVLDGMGSVGVELVTNGGFDTDTAWTKGAAWTISAGAATCANLAANEGTSRELSQVLLTVGKTYSYSVSVTTSNAVNITLSIGANTGITSTDGTKTGYFVAASSIFALGYSRTGSASGAFTIDNISVKEVTGIHATQATTMAKPRLERGVRNLLTYSQANSNWASDAATTVVTDNSAVGVLGASTASTFTITGAGYKYGLSVSTTSLVMTGAAWVKGASGTVALRIGSNGSAETASTVVTLNGQWQLVVVQLTSTGAPAAYKLGIDNRGLAGADAASKVVFVDGAALFQGTLTAAQILAEGGIPLTTTAAASNPNAGKYSWSFDGGDSLALGSVPFQMSDDHAVIVGLNCTSVASSARAFSCASTASNTPRICDVHLNSSGFAVANWVDDAAVVAAITGSTDLRGQAVVISARKVGNNKILRVNGVQIGSVNTTALGATTVTSASIGVLPIASPTGYFNGSTGPINPIKGTLTDSEMLTLERVVASLTPNAPSF